MLPSAVIVGGPGDRSEDEDYLQGRFMPAYVWLTRGPDLSPPCAYAVSNSSNPMELCQPEQLCMVYCSLPFLRSALFSLPRRSMYMVVPCF